MFHKVKPHREIITDGQLISDALANSISRITYGTLNIETHYNTQREEVSYGFSAETKDNVKALLSSPSTRCRIKRNKISRDLSDLELNAWNSSIAVEFFSEPEKRALVYQHGVSVFDEKRKTLKIGESYFSIDILQAFLPDRTYVYTPINATAHTFGTCERFDDFPFGRPQSENEISHIGADLFDNWPEDISVYAYVKANDILMRYDENDLDRLMFP